MIRIVLGVIAGFVAWVIAWVGGEKILSAMWPEVSRATSFPRVGHKYSPTCCVIERSWYGIEERLSSGLFVEGRVNA